MNEETSNVVPMKRMVDRSRHPAFDYLHNELLTGLRTSLTSDGALTYERPRAPGAASGKALHISRSVHFAKQEDDLQFMAALSAPHCSVESAKLGECSNNVQDLDSLHLRVIDRRRMQTWGTTITYFAGFHDAAKHDFFAQYKNAESKLYDPYINGLYDIIPIRRPIAGYSILSAGSTERMKTMLDILHNGKLDKEIQARLVHNLEEDKGSLIKSPNDMLAVQPRLSGILHYMLSSQELKNWSAGLK